MSKLFEEPCPNCGSNEGLRRIYQQVEVNGQNMTVVFCDRCPKVEVQQEFPAILKSGTIDKYRLRGKELSSEEIKKTQALRGSVPVMQDSIEKRKLDDVKLKTVHVGATYGNNGNAKAFRQRKIETELMKLYGNRKYEIVSDNGFEVKTREAVATQ